MASFNKVILAGNLTRDPELRTLPSGSSVTKFSIAVNRRYTTKDGEQREEVTYVDVESFGRQAENIAKYCTKGSGLLLEGRLKLDQWDDKNGGGKRSKLSVFLENFTFLSNRGGEDGSGGGYEDNSPSRRSNYSSPRSTPTAPSNDGIEEDVPF